MGHFATAEAHSNFHLVAAVKEFLHGFGFHAIIMRVDIRTHLDFFKRLGPLILAVGSFFLLIFKAHLAVVEDFANGRLSGRDFDEVESGVTGSREGFSDRDSAPFFSVGEDEQDIIGGNVAVDARAFGFFGGLGREGSSSDCGVSWWFQSVSAYGGFKAHIQGKAAIFPKVPKPGNKPQEWPLAGWLSRNSQRFDLSPF